MRNGTRAFFLDLDGTLLASGEKRPSDVNMQAISRARNEGHLVFLNTGRSFAFLPEFAKRDDFGLDGLVCGNGSYIMIGGEVKFSVLVPDEAIAAMAPLYDNGGIEWVVLEGERANYTMRYPREGSIEIASVTELLTTYAPARVTKLTAGGIAPTHVRETLQKWFWICQMETYYEAMLKGCSKSSGIDRVLQMYGIPLENAIAIGDSGNDADMLRHAGTGVAMGNATPPALEAADETTADCLSDGVAQTILKYIKR